MKKTINNYRKKKVLKNKFIGENMKSKLFQVAILLHTVSGKDAETKSETKIIGSIETMLAKDEKQAGIMAARKIPDEYMDRLDHIEVILRPF